MCTCALGFDDEAISASQKALSLNPWGVYDVLLNQLYGKKNRMLSRSEAVQRQHDGVSAASEDAEEVVKQ